MCKCVIGVLINKEEGRKEMGYRIAGPSL